MEPDFITKVRLHAWMCLLILLPLKVAGQQPTITGTVVDEYGETLPGVALVTEGNTGGVSPDIDGKYSINAPPGNVPVFSSAGMNSRTITVGMQIVINVTLTEATTEIESVVVAGCGVQKKETVDRAVSQIPGEEFRSITMQIRAGASMGSNSPLILVDRYHKVIFRA